MEDINLKNAEIKKLFYRFLYPTVLGMIFSAVFIVTDGVFVGKGLGSDALAAVNLVSPLYMIATGVGLMFGMGTSVIASIYLAKGKNKMANINITQSVVISCILMFLTTVLVLLFRKEILVMFNTPEDLQALADQYLFCFSLFLMPIALFNVLMFIIRLDGSPKFAMICNIVAAILNIVLDYFFIFVFKWGMKGAAIATGIGIVVGVLFMLIYLFGYFKVLCFTKIRLGYRNILLAIRSVVYIVQSGFPALLGELAISCMMVVGNYTFIKYIGKDGVAAFSIACYIFPIIYMVYNGIIQSAQPIVSFNFGINDGQRMRDTFLLALKTSVFCGVCFFLISCLFNSWLIGLFLRPDVPAYKVALEGLPYFASGYIFFGMNVIVIGYYQSINRGKFATMLMVQRGIVLMIFSFLILPKWLGVKGIWLAVPFAEFLLVIFLFFLVINRKMRMREIMQNV